MRQHMEIVFFFTRSKIYKTDTIVFIYYIWAPCSSQLSKIVNIPLSKFELHLLNCISVSEFEPYLLNCISISEFEPHLRNCILITPLNLSWNKHSKKYLHGEVNQLVESLKSKEKHVNFAEYQRKIDI